MLALRFYDLLAQTVAAEEGDHEMLDKLSARAVESGREHPFVQSLEREIESRLNDVTAKLLETVGSDDKLHRIYQLGGRVAELKNILRLIRDAGTAEPA